MKINREKYSSWEKNIYSNNFLLKKTPKAVIIGVSGWPDSMVTSHLVIDFYKKKSPKTQIIIAHFNHHQRKESDKDELFIKSHFTNQTIEIWHYEKTKATEEKLRKARHAFFEKTAKKYKTKIIFLGHNLTDRIETSILNMARGCELDWFTNMQTQTQKWDLTIIRPLLHLTKEEITSIAKKEKIPFIIDKSNLSIKTSKRNYIRIKILPLLEKISNKCQSGRPNIYESFSKIYNTTENTKKNTRKKNIKDYKIHWIWTEIKCRQRTRQTLTQTDIAKIIKHLQPEKNRNKIFIKQAEDFLNKWETNWFIKTGDIFFFKAHQKIFICQSKEKFREKEIETKKKITTLKEVNFWNQKIKITPELLWATLRFPKRWDKRWNKSLKKTFINNKIPFFERNYIPIAEKNNKIIKIFYPVHSSKNKWTEKPTSMK